MPDTERRMTDEEIDGVKWNLDLMRTHATARDFWTPTLLAAQQAIKQLTTENARLRERQEVVMHDELSTKARAILAEARQEHAWNSDVIAWLEDALGECLGLDLTEQEDGNDH